VIIKSPVLYDSKGAPITSSSSFYQYRKPNARHAGALQNWVPQRLFNDTDAARERETISARVIDICNADPNANGVIEAFASTVIGTGLNPNYTIDSKKSGLSKEKIDLIKKQMFDNFKEWQYFSDMQGQKTFAQILFLLEKSLVKYGEYFVLLPMIDDDERPFSLACQVIHPMRVKTPADKIHDEKIRDGVEFNAKYQPIAYWVKKNGDYDDSSKNFHRITRKSGHRYKVIHYFNPDDPEQVRGISMLSPMLKLFRDFADYLDAELMSNVVTAAFSMFIETNADPYTQAQNLATITDNGFKSDNSSYEQRYQEMVPGQIMYGSPGEKPHPISASRPGGTFDPFTRIIKKAIAQGLGIPFPVLYRDFDGMNYASYRSAMLEAWRVFKRHREDIGTAFCQPVHDMIQEEAFLRDKLDVNYYEMPKSFFNAKWIGPPKGQIEPIKELQADIIAIQNNLKTRSQVITEQGGSDNFESIVEKIKEEQELLKNFGLDEQPFVKEDERDDSNEF